MEALEVLDEALAERGEMNQFVSYCISLSIKIAIEIKLSFQLTQFDFRYDCWQFKEEKILLRL